MLQEYMDEIREIMGADIEPLLEFFNTPSKASA